MVENIAKGGLLEWVVKFRSVIFPFVFCLVLKKNEEESVVGKTKIHLLLLIGFILWFHFILFLFSFCLSFVALKLLCLLKCLYNIYYIFFFSLVAMKMKVYTENN